MACCLLLPASASAKAPVAVTATILKRAVLLAWMCNTDRQLAIAETVPVETRDRRLGLLLRVHLQKCKSFGIPRGTVLDQRHRHHRAGLRKQLAQGLLRS